jgi:hypothetical protein
VRIPFDYDPTQFELPNHQFSVKETQIIHSEISDLLLVNAIGSLDYQPRCVSPLGVVHKKYKA